ncbi:hypothetical protein GQ600_2863 [Phytophthora cactorum]|nr:hypothetical protein GQ600_2863 [Phytophthora cactorum]
MASETQPPSTSVGLFAEPAPSPPEPEPPTKKRRRAGRKRDPVWEFTTVFADKRVVCNRCGALIHRYGVAKVERVRAHFERKCDASTEGQRGDRDYRDGVDAVSCGGGDQAAQILER